MSEPARSEPPRALEVRVGSATSALQPLSSVERSLSPGAAQWVALAAVSTAAVVADQLTKWLVTGTLGLGESVAVLGPFSIHFYGQNPDTLPREQFDPATGEVRPVKGRVGRL